MRQITAIALASLLLAPFGSLTAGEAGFEGGVDELVVALGPPSFSGIANLSVPAGSYATSAKMYVSGMASETDPFAYPEKVSLGINGTEIWGFRGSACGELGEQDSFFTGKNTVEFEFGKDGGSSGTRIRLPKDAVVRSALVNLTSGPKFSKQELANFTSTGLIRGLGKSVAGAGDLNGDGIDDIIIGGSQVACIYFGGQIINISPDFIMTSEQTYDHFGYAVSGAGDVNGDGYDDVIVGASEYDKDIDNIHVGKVYLFLGGQAMDNSSDWSFAGYNRSDEIGYAISSAGDVNDDGFDDFLIGSSSHSFVYLVLGASVLDDMTILEFHKNPCMFGASIGRCGDVNGDGYDDIIIGAPAEGFSPPNMGAAYIYFGGKNMDSQPDVSFTATCGTIWLGISVSGAGDMNDDGYNDVIVLSVVHENIMPGTAFVLLGAPLMDNATDYNLSGIYTNDGASPQSVACAGDVNGDGVDDVLVGAYFDSSIQSEAGAAHLFYGGRYMDDKADWSFAGAGAGDHFGFAVAGAGDVNNDGFDDFLISAPRNDSGASGKGRVYLYSLVNTTFRGPVNSSLTVNTKQVWNYPGVFLFGSSMRTGNFADELNQYLRSAAPTGSDEFGNEYVDVPLIGFAQTEGTLKLSNLTIVFDCEFKVDDFSGLLNRYLEANQWSKDTEGNILIPINVSSTGAGRVKLFNLNFTWDLPPSQIKDFDGIALDEDTAATTLADLTAYFKDDNEASADLKYSIVSSTNATFVRLWITANRYLSADAMTGDANDNWSGTVEAVVACADHWGRTMESRPFTITVRNVNDAPVIVSEPVLEARIGLPYSYNVSGVDGDNDPLVFSLAEAPANMSIDASSGRISWVPERKGLYGVTVVASDGVLSGSQDFEITVPNSAPRITDATVPEALVGVPWNFTVPAVDDDGDALAFSLVSGIPEMMINTTTGRLNWTPSEAGNYSVTVGISDGEANVSRDFAIAVVQGNRAPLFTSEPARNGTVGLPYVYEARAADPDSDAVAFSVVSGPLGMMINGTSGTVDWTPAMAGNFTVRILASDGRGGEAFQEFIIDVSPKKLPKINIITPFEGQRVRGQITVAGNTAKGTQDVENIQIRVDSGDWINISNGPVWEYTLNTTLLPNGPHILQVRAFDGEDFSEVCNRTFIVDNVASVGDQINPFYWIIIIISASAMALFIIGRRLSGHKK